VIDIFKRKFITLFSNHLLSVYLTNKLNYSWFL